MDEEYVKKLAVARLRTLPPNTGFSLTPYGSFTRDEIIREIENDSRIGKIAVTIQINSVRNSARITKWLEDE